MSWLITGGVERHDGGIEVVPYRNDPMNYFFGRRRRRVGRARSGGRLPRVRVVVYYGASPGS